MTSKDRHSGGRHITWQAFHGLVANDDRSNWQGTYASGLNRLEEMDLQLDTNISRLRRALDQVTDTVMHGTKHGIAVFDENHCLVRCNDSFRALLEMPEALCRPGVGMAEIFGFKIIQGQLDGSRSEEMVADLVSAFNAADGCSTQLLNVNGREIEVLFDLLPTGRRACIYMDVTPPAISLLQNTEGSKPREVPMSYELMAGRASQRLMPEDVAKCWAQRRVFPYFQPLVDANARMVGFESLMRGLSEDQRLIMPHEFIPIAERDGSILEFDLWIIECVCHSMRDWAVRGFDYGCVGINISPKQLRNPYFVSSFEACLERYGVASDRIEFEIPESALVGNAQDILPLLRNFSERGIQLVVDNFGTGRAGLSLLRDFPVKKLKIDPWYVMGVGRETRVEGLIRSMLNIGNRLDLEVAAVGVETEEQVEFLTRNGCSLFQGSLFGQPETAESYVSTGPAT